jgi:hypothetical protein
LYDEELTVGNGKFTSDEDLVVERGDGGPTPAVGEMDDRFDG